MVGSEETQVPRELPIAIENRLIAGDIQWSIDRAVQAGYGLREGTAAVFKGKNNPDFEVNLRKVQNGIVGFPEEFEYPVYNLQDWHVGMDMSRATTSQGWLDEYFKDREGRVYATVNSYYFNLIGKAIKSEEINNMIELGDEAVRDILRRRGLYLEELREVDFIPEEGRKFVDLEPGDYEKVRGILWQIQKGELTTE